jgi:hypothetical protein
MHATNGTANGEANGAAKSALNGTANGAARGALNGTANGTAPGGATAARPPDAPPLNTVSDGASAPTAAPAAAPAGRSPGGRFAPGNKLGGGNPFHRKQAALRRAFAEAVGEGQLQALARRLYERALEGDAACAKLLLAHVLGKPTDAVDPDGVDADEWRRLEAGPTHPELLRVQIDHLDPAHAVEMLRGVLPADFQEAAGRLADTKRSDLRGYGRRIVRLLEAVPHRVPVAVPVAAVPVAAAAPQRQRHPVR